MSEQSKRPFSRRRFVGAAAASSLARAGESDRPALLGGAPVRGEAFPGWPVRDDVEDRAMLEVVRSGRWGRGTGGAVAAFESKYAQSIGARHCLATSSGTSALFTALAALGIGPGDEVVLPPYTFVACVNVILLHHAIPVFADTDPNTFQIDASKLESKIGGRTAALMPVHLGGATFDVAAILATARKHNLPLSKIAASRILRNGAASAPGRSGPRAVSAFRPARI